MIESKAAVAGFLATVALLLANAGVSYWNTDRLVHNDNMVLHTREVIGTLEQVLASVADAETGQRGFLITGGDKYWQTYQVAKARLPQLVDNLKRLTSDNPHQQAHVAALKNLVQQRLDRLQHNADVRRNEGYEAAQRIVGTDQGHFLMDSIRGLVESMTEEESALLKTRMSESARSLHAKVVTNVIGTVLGISAVCLAFILFERTLSERRRKATRARDEAARHVALGELRQRALSEESIDELLDKATQLVAETLNVPLVKILELTPSREAFLLRAGVGWSAHTVGKSMISAGLDSQAGFTLQSSEPSVSGDLTTHQPVIVEDLRREKRFDGSRLLEQYDVVSGMSVIVYDQPNQPFGVLGAHTNCQRQFTDEEARFLQAMANVLASALQRRRAEDALRESEKRFRALADSVPEIVWTSLPDGRCNYVNQSLVRIHRYGTRRDTGLRVGPSDTPGRCGAIQATLDAQHGNGRTVRMRVSFPHPQWFLPLDPGQSVAAA